VLQRQPDPPRVLLAADEGPECSTLQERAFNAWMERLDERLEGRFLRLFAPVARAARVVRALALCERRARLSGSMRARLCARSPSCVSSVPYSWQPLPVRPCLRKSVAPQRRQVTASMVGPSSSESMTATSHEPSVKSRPLPMHG
jgi:hypothetical protein